MESAIDVTDLVTHYGDREILKKISFSIPKGKTTVILGGSGCGKSTLLETPYRAFEAYQRQYFHGR